MSSTMTSTMPLSSRPMDIVEGLGGEQDDGMDVTTDESDSGHDGSVLYPSSRDLVMIDYATRDRRSRFTRATDPRSLPNLSPTPNSVSSSIADSLAIDKDWYCISDSDSDFDPENVDRHKVARVDSNSTHPSLAALATGRSTSPSLHDHTPDRLEDPLAVKSFFKKVKMHDCKICGKSFPRPSGLATHMNSHSGARPYACLLPTCNKTFAVRSNARRHLRTHGITPPSSTSRNGPRAPPPFEVLFETPLVASSAEHDKNFNPPRMVKVRRVPASLASRTNAARLRSLSPGSDMADLDADADGEDEWEYQYRYHHYRPPVPKTVPTPLPPVTPSEPSTDPDEKFEERNSYAEAGTFPYHPEQVRVLMAPIADEMPD